MSLEILIVAVLSFFLVPLLSALGPWLRKQLEELEHRAAAEATRAAGPPVSVSVRQPVAPEATVKVAARPSAARPPRPAAVRVPAPRRTALAGLGSRRELRRSMVLMAILGPCRALEPPSTS
jgi:hypothetical protein